MEKSAQEDNSVLSAQEAHIACVATNFPRVEIENERGEQRDETGLKEFLELQWHRLNFLSTSSTAETNNKNYCD